MYRSFSAVALLLLTLSSRAFGQVPPVANSVAYSVAVNTPLKVPAGNGVLAYDFDPNGLVMTAGLKTAPTNGTVALNADGSFIYTPNGDFMGFDSFNYAVSDTNLTSAIATVTLDVGNERWDDQFSPSGFGLAVNAISVAANGDVYAGGSQARDIARWDGRVWSKMGNRLLNGVNGSTYALAWLNGDLIVGGGFTSAGGRPAGSLAQWDGSTWTAFPGGGINGLVQALAVSDGFLYAAGQFTSVGSVGTTNVAGWDGTNWFALGAGVDGPVASMVADTNGAVYVAGGFTNAGGVTVNGIAVWNGGSWRALGTGVRGSIQALLVQDGQLYAGGSFTNIGGISATNLARWDGVNWFALGKGAPGGVVYSLAFHNGQLYAGQNTPRDTSGPARVLVWNGTNWSALPQISYSSGPADILTLTFKGDTLLAGGWFNSAGNAVVNNLAAWDGQNWSAVNNALGGNNTFAAATQGTNVYLGGDFTSAAGTRVGSIVRWDGVHWWPLGAGSSNGVNQTVYALASGPSGPLYAGGNFSRAGGIAVNNVAQWDGTNWTPLGTGTTNGLNGTVYSLRVDSSGNLIAGGSFTRAGGGIATNIARWDGHGWSALAKGLNGSVLALAEAGTDLYAGGSFTSSGGVSMTNIARWDGARWNALGNGIGTANPRVVVQSLAVRGPLVFAGAQIASPSGGRILPWVSRWDGSTWTTIATNLLNKTAYPTAVNALEVVGGDLYAGGLFSMVNSNSLYTASIARWDGAGWFPLGTGVGDITPTIFALASQGDELLAAGAFTIAGVQPSTLFGRWRLADVPPVVALTSPSPNSGFIVGADIDLAVDAGDTYDPIVQVGYYAGSTLVGVSTTPPYSLTWSNVFTGVYTLYAAATDTAGQTTFSDPLRITVSPPDNDFPPSVDFINPTNNSFFPTGQAIALQVGASDSDGSIRQIAFYDNSTLIALVTNAPYSLSWSGGSIGSHTLLAVAMDNLGATNSDSVQINLQEPPIVSVDQPAAGARYVAPGYVYLEANAYVSPGTIVRVDFYTNGVFFVSANIPQSPEYGYRWSNPPFGNYSLTALAVDGHGFSALSPPIQFSIVASNTPAISITTPAPGAVYSAPTNILVTVNVSDSYPIQSVQLYNNGMLFGTVTNAPYVFVLRNLTQTTYNFVARVLDTWGYTNVSFPVSVTVTNDPGREPLFNLTDVGALLGPASEAQGVNGAGIVVGGSTTATSGYRPFVGNNGVVQWLPLLGGQSLGGGGEALGINDSNMITGYAATGSGYGHAFRFDGSNIVDLGTFGGQQSSGAAINASGEVAGSAGDANNALRAFLYSNGSLTNLDTFGSTNSAATAINTAGQVVGYAEFPPNHEIGFLYTPGAGNQILGDLGGPVCQPLAINDASQIAGAAWTSDLYTHAFLSLEGFTIDLGTLGGFNSAALGLNNFGQIVGWSENDNGLERAFLWQNDVMYDLNDLIPANSGWTLRRACAINDAGQIVGRGLHGSDGNYHAFLLTIATNSPVQPRSTRLLDYTAGRFNLNLPVPRGIPLVLQASTDLQTWIPIATNYDRNGLVNFADLHGADRRYYRAVPLH